MRGHWQSGTRKLNRHYQSGEGYNALDIYMHCNYPASAYSPGSENVNILINPPQEGVIQNIEIDRSNKPAANQEKFNHLSLKNQNIMFPLWNQLDVIFGWGSGHNPGDREIAYTSHYYYPTLAKGNDAYYMSLFTYPKMHDIINLFCGGFYGIQQYNEPTQSMKTFSYFNDKNTRTRFYGPIWLPFPSDIEAYAADLTESVWQKLLDLYNKIHIWLPYPSQSIILNPSTRLGTGTMYNSHNQSMGQVQYEYHPFTLALEDNNMSGFRYHEFMENYSLDIHIHLPSDYDITYLSKSPAYVREYQHLVDADVWKWNIVPIGGNDYCRKIFITGPMGAHTSSTPGASSPWYHKTFREYMPIGNIIPICDIDLNKTVEENAQDYYERTFS